MERWFEDSRFPILTVGMIFSLENLTRSKTPPTSIDHNVPPTYDGEASALLHEDRNQQMNNEFYDAAWSGQ